MAERIDMTGTNKLIWIRRPWIKQYKANINNLNIFRLKNISIK
jgi:hypothetical protein